MSDFERKMRSYQFWVLWIPLVSISAIFLVAISVNRPLGSILSQLLISLLMPWTWAEGFFRGVGIKSHIIGISIYLGLLVFFLKNLKSLSQPVFRLLSVALIIVCIFTIKGCGAMVGRPW